MRTAEALLSNCTVSYSVGTPEVECKADHLSFRQRVAALFVLTIWALISSAHSFLKRNIAVTFPHGMAGIWFHADR